MTRLELARPTIILLYGYPGAGKTFLARQLSEELKAAHIEADRLHNEVFEKPVYDKREDEIVAGLMNYLTEELIKAGVSVIYDVNAAKPGQRRGLREMSNKLKAITVLAWLQIDVESAFTRVSKRDRRKADDRYAQSFDRTSFDQVLTNMKNPSQSEEYVVVSGKHNYQTQRGAIVKKLYEMGLIPPEQANDKLVKPGLVNLVPNLMAGRVDPSRRNIVIR